MDLYELMEYRRSVRHYKPQTIEKDKLERVLNAARLSPSGNNIQPWKFILVKDAATKRKMVPLCWNQKFVAEAPLVIVACALKVESTVGGVIPTHVVDTSIAVTHLMLAAAHEGLGTCWVGAFESQPVKELLAIPDDVEIVAIIPIGFPVDDARVVKSRKSFDQIICEERFG
ncbi:MAG TPA: nitroreductase family protein [Planctomycetota bacterium]|nr:nitroreductase family protein [Planctomycetota bacterium]HUW32620.1 nitroreductase family protein [Planctomycetota bacterium]